MTRGIRSRWALPANTEPENVRCFQIEIPDEPMYIAAFKGALYELAKPYAWQNDENHTALTVGARMITAYASIQEVACGGSVQLRVCESGCGIEVSNDNGATWECIDLTDCIATIWDEKMAGAFDDGLLGKGTQQTGPGGVLDADVCRTYHVQLNANEQWHSPVPINDRYTIHVTNATGGWNDGTPLWYCPDGSGYLLGQCVGDGLKHDETDPLTPDAWHMAIIGNHGTTPFDPLTAVYTVPDGTGQVDFVLQANDGLLTDNSGQVSFDVEICAAPAMAWCYYFDFTTSEQSWTPMDFGGGAQAVWESGEGWAHGTNLHEIIIIPPAFEGPINVTIRILLDGVPEGANPKWIWDLGGGAQPIDWGTLDYHEETIGNLSTFYWIGFDDAWGTYWNSSPTNRHIKAVMMYYTTGTNPFGGDNCPE